MNDLELGDVVVFAENGAELKVERWCGSCARHWDTVQEDYAVVSPHGVAHVGADYGRTACGRDATGPDWWWKS